MGSIENEEGKSDKSISPAADEQLNRTDVESPSVSLPSQESQVRDSVNEESQNDSIPTPQTIVESAELTSSNVPAIEAVPNVIEDFAPSTHSAEVPTTGEPHSVNSEQNHELQEAGVLTAADQEKSVPIETEVSISTDSSTRETDQKVEPLDKRKIVTHNKENAPSVKLQDQLDEVKYMLCDGWLMLASYSLVTD